MHSLYLQTCTPDVLNKIPFPSGLIAWAPRYGANQRHNWHDAQLALAPELPLQQMRVRGIAFEFQLPFEELLPLLPGMGDHGLELFLMDREVTARFDPETIPEAHRDEALIAHGLVAHFDLPHAREIACLRTPNAKLLERWSTDPGMAELICERFP